MKKEEIHNLCGFNCFTKKLGKGKWVSISEGNEFEIDFSKYVIRQWLYQDEYVDYDCTFFDMYLLVTK